MIPTLTLVFVNIIVCHPQTDYIVSSQQSHKAKLTGFYGGKMVHTFFSWGKEL